MKSMREIVSVAGVAALMVAGLGADSAHAGCYVGIGAGASMASSSIGIGQQSTRPDLGVHGGCDMRLPNSPVFVGTFADWKNKYVAFEVSPSLLKASLWNSYTLE